MRALNNYRILQFVGGSDGSALVADFDMSSIIGRLLTVKRILLVPYAPSADSTTLLYQADNYDPLIANAMGGASKFWSLAPEEGNLYGHYIYDHFQLGITNFTFKVNGVPLNIIGTTLYNLPAQPFDFDNIMASFPQPISLPGIEIAVTGNISYDAVSIQTGNFQVKIILEVFLDPPQTIKTIRNE